MSLLENRKRKNTEQHEGNKKARPAAVSAWQPAHVADYLRACAPRDNAAVADAIEHEGISGRTAMQLTEEDLRDMTRSLTERNSALAALEDLRHPLMPAFIQMDTDQSNTISAPELAHVLTRVKGRCVTNGEASELIKSADVDRSGDVDFSEFKGILESDGATDWASAAEAVGAPRALLNAAMAFRSHSDDMLVRTHTAFRSGSGRIHGDSPLTGLQLPTPGMRFFVIEFLALLPAWIFVFMTCSIGFWYMVFCLWPRGQVSTGSHPSPTVLLTVLLTLTVSQSLPLPHSLPLPDPLPPSHTASLTQPHTLTVSPTLTAPHPFVIVC